MNAITLTPVKSSAIKAWGYDAAGRVLAIETPQGKTYRYGDVPQDVADAFGKAESLGKAWGSMIRGHFALVEFDAKAASEAA